MQEPGRRCDGRVGVEVDDQVTVGGVGTDDLGNGDCGRAVPGGQAAGWGQVIVRLALCGEEDADGDPGAGARLGG